MCLNFEHKLFKNTPPNPPHFHRSVGRESGIPPSGTPGAAQPYAPVPEEAPLRISSPFSSAVFLKMGFLEEVPAAWVLKMFLAVLTTGTQVICETKQRSGF